MIDELDVYEINRVVLWAKYSLMIFCGATVLTTGAALVMMLLGGTARFIS